MQTERWVWPAPSVRRLLKLLMEPNVEIETARAERYRFVLQEFGPPGDTLLTGGIGAMFALHELRATFIDGHYLATILTAQILVEHSLASSFIFSGEDEIAEAGLSLLLSKSVELGFLTEFRAESLRELQRMRIAYGHAHVGLKSRSLMKRLLNQGQEPEGMLEADARSAIRIVADWLRDQQPERHPAHPDWAREVKSTYRRW